MEFVDGEDLASLLKRIGRLPADKALDISRELCAGLAAAHDKGVLHRDLKPANVMVDGRGRARITDFGLAVAAGEVVEGEVSGTPAYMAPEQLEGKGASVRSDIYALGLVLYELYTGRKAFEGASFQELKRKHSKEVPVTPSTVSPGFDPVVERVILRCLEKDPARRPASVSQVAAALPGGDPLAAALAAGETPSPEMVAAAGEEGALAPGRAWALLGAVAVTILIVLLLMPFRDGSRPRAAAQEPRCALRPRERGRAEARLRAGRPPIPPSGGTASTTCCGTAPITFPRPGAFESSRPSSPTRGGSGTGRARARWCRGTWTRWWAKTIRRSRSSAWSASRWTPAATSSASAPSAADRRIEAGVSRPRLGCALPRGGTGFQALPSLGSEVASAGIRGRAGRVGWQLRSAARRADPRHGRRLSRQAGLLRGPRPLGQAAADAGRPLKLAQAARGAGGLHLIVLGVLAAGVIFARRNLRLGRGDPRGAFRVSSFVVVLSILAWLLFAHHVTDLLGEFGVAPEGPGIRALEGGVRVAGLLALEPYVRRKWPDLLISWTRLLSGKFQDPLVGRDVLIRLFFGGLILSSFSSTTVWRRSGTSPA